MQLVIGNKNYSSWSMRPWVLMTQAGIPFDEIRLRFDDFSPDSNFKREILRRSPAGRVPVLHDGELTVWDSLAICETLAERYPGKRLWPEDAADRARARSICAEMHAGFGALRQHLPMNIEASLPEIGERIWAEQPAVRQDHGRIVEIWTDGLARRGGPMLFGEFGIADAFYAPVAMRFRTYGLPCPRPVAGYLDRVVALPAVAAWIREALDERDFVAADEPYRAAPG